MKSLKIKNLDQLYATIKSEVGKLWADGYSVMSFEVYYEDSNSLLQWFFKNISKLKEGVQDLKVAYAMETEQSNYTVYRDDLKISSIATPLGLLITINRFEYGYYYNSGNPTFENKDHKQVFLLEIE